ncbi:MAG: hypothetical protein RMM98_09775 [Acidobacteriota bacterium]|nr:hypothetical protein [Blastocatellia bacterium]MDW8239891.1 hypothetical protein [Acidobacteriota bacterium]
MTQMIAMLILLALCFFTGNLGAFASDSNHLVGGLIIFVAFLMIFPSLQSVASLWSKRQRLFALVSTASAVITGVMAESPLVWLAAACLFAYGLSAWFEGEASAQWSILGLTAALYLMIFAFFYPLEPFWRLSLNGAVSATRKVGALVDHLLIAGPSASGWWICLLFACYVVARFVIEKCLWRLTLGVVSVVVLFAGFNLISLHYPPWRYHTHTGLNLFNSQILCYALGAGVFYLLYGRMNIPEAVESQPRFWFVLLAPVLVVVSVGAHDMAVKGWEKESKGGQVVIFGTEPSASYGTPSFDRLGVGASGMYGLLPNYLRAAGFDVTIVEQTEKLNETLDRAQVLVIISPTEIFPPELHQRIWKFVETGRSLLVMGDHTDIFGTMRPLNDLLAPVNVSFNFDSAYPARNAWRYCYESLPHPVTRSLDQVNDVLQYGVGASLSVSAPAYPIIIGKFAFSNKDKIETASLHPGSARRAGACKMRASQITGHDNWL